MDQVKHFVKILIIYHRHFFYRSVPKSNTDAAKLEFIQLLQKQVNKHIFHFFRLFVFDNHIQLNFADESYV
jgi:hypothetical protein